MKRAEVRVVDLALLLLVAAYPAAAALLLRRIPEPEPSAGRGLRLLLAATTLIGLPVGMAEATLDAYSGISPVPCLFTLVPTASAAAVLALGQGGDRGLVVAIAFAGASVVPCLAWRASPGVPEATHCEGCWTDLVGAPPLWRESMRIRGASDDRDYPEGWLAESPILASYPRERALLGERVRRVRHHARPGPLSGIVGKLRVERVPVALWYPGGRIREAIDRTAYRPLGP